MIDPEVFDVTLRKLIKKETFVPFTVELADGQSIQIRRPKLAFGGGSAAFLDSKEGLVDFSHKDVVAFRIQGQEVEM